MFMKTLKQLGLCLDLLEGVMTSRCVEILIFVYPKPLTGERWLLVIEHTLNIPKLKTRNSSIWDPETLRNFEILFMNGIETLYQGLTVIQPELNSGYFP